MDKIEIGDIVEFLAADGAQGRGKVIAFPQPAIAEIRTGSVTHLAHLADCKIVFKAP